MSPKDFKHINHLELDISLHLPNFSKEISQLTYWQTSKEGSKKIQKGISSRAGNIPKFVRSHQGSMPTTRLTDIQTNLNYLYPVYQHLRKVSKKFQKDISSRTGDITLSYLSKEVSKKQISWCVCQSGSWHTSLMKSDKFRNISISRWVIFLSFYGYIPRMLIHLFQIILNF